VTPSHVLVLSFLIGVIAGLRSLTAPAVVAWGAHRNWLSLHDSLFSFMASTASVAVLTALMLFELVMDKRPSTPSRLRPPGLIARIMLGGLSGAALATAGSQSVALGAILGAVGGIAGSFAGYALRTRLVRALEVPDFVIACMEDLVAIGGGLLIVSRF
jgi:uncharacterized membrane protein